MHGLDEADLVSDLRRVRQQLAQRCARLPVLSELVDRRRSRKVRLMSRHPRQPLSSPYRLRKILAAKSLQLRLGIEEFQLRRSARLKQVDHTFRFGREMGQSRKRSGWWFA